MKALLNDRRSALLVLIALAMIGMSVASPFFLRADNLLELTQYSAVIGLLALGQSLVMLGGGAGIDLSVGSTLSLSSVFFGILAVGFEFNPWVAAVATLVFGACLGLINGLLVNQVRIPPLIATLGTLYLYGSLALVLSNGLDQNGFDRDGFSALSQTVILGVPTQVVVVLVPSFILVSLILYNTKFGREIYEAGSNADAARLSGVNVPKVRTMLYMISGTCAGLGAVVTASWLLNAKSTAGVGMELQSITIAVLGGIVITGGVGRILNVFLAVLLIAILNSGMALAGIGTTYQIGLLGVVLILSMLIRGRTGAPVSVA